MSAKARNGIRRSIKTSQIGLFEMNLTISTAVTAAVTGFDRARVKEVIRLGDGNVTIVLKRAYTRPPILKSAVIVSGGFVVKQEASDFDRITLQIVDETDTAIDGVANITILGSDSRFDY